jgi:hypothetical protein
MEPEEWTVEETVEYDMEDKTNLFKHTEYRNPAGKLVFSVTEDLQPRDNDRDSTYVHDQTEYKRYEELTKAALIRFRELEPKKIPYY